MSGLGCPGGMEALQSRCTFLKPGTPIAELMDRTHTGASAADL